MLDEALETAEADVQHADRDYMDAKRYMAEYRGEIDPNEMFQNELLLRQTDHTGALAVRTRDILAKLRESPYFARIDFSEKMAVCLPSPVTSGALPSAITVNCLSSTGAPLFPACFTIMRRVLPAMIPPMGRVEGIITRKRQFKIADGVMEYAIESSSSIQDDILQKNFHTSDEKNEIDHCHHTDRAKPDHPE